MGGDVELQPPSGGGNRLSVVEIDGRKRSNSAASHSSQLSKLSTGEYYGDSKELEESKKEAEKSYAKDKVPGPIAKRHCRDIFWLFLFIQYWVIMFVIAYFAITEGDPARLLVGMDSEGNLCSRNNSKRDLTNYPYLYYFDLLSPYDGYTKCVSECPNVTIDFATNSTNGPLSSAICAYDFVPNDALELADAIENGTCTGLIYPGFVVVGRCFPNLTGDLSSLPLYDNIEQNFVTSLAENGFSFEFQRDLYAAWPVLLICAGIALTLSFLWVIFLQLCAGFMVFVSIAFLVLTTLASMVYLWYRYYQLHTGDTVAIFDFITDNFLSTLSSYTLSENTYLGCAITVTVISVIFYLALIFLRKRILLAIAVIKIASKAVKHVPMLVFFPVLKFLMLLALTGWFVYILVNLATAGTITQIDFAGYYTFESNHILEYLQLYYLFGFLWAWNVTIAIGDCTIAGVIGTYYWTMDKKKLPRFMIIPALYRTFRYHLGSLAFGSFIIALVQFIRYLLYKTEKKLKGSQNAFLKHLLKILQCLFLCFERFLKFLNKNAYIEIAIYGYGFCKAAKWAFQLITRNIIRVFVISKLGDFLLLIGKVIITILTAIAGNILIEYYSTEPTYWLTPMIVIILFAYGTAYCFMAILDMSVSTIFLCFCEDIERNDGSAERPFYMDPKLRKYVDKEAKAQSDMASK